jgi:hypothetical protein
MSTPLAARKRSSGLNFTCSTSPNRPKKLNTARWEAKSHTTVVASPAGALGDRACPLARKRPEALTSSAVTSASWPFRKACLCGSYTSAMTTWQPSAITYVVSLAGWHTREARTRPV